MAELALQVLFAASCTAPFIVAALQVRRAGAAAGWCAAALVAALVSVQANPLLAALQHVDGTVLRGGCGVR